MQRFTPIIAFLLGFASTGPLHAQLFEHPSAYAVPDATAIETDRALAISLTFNSTTGITIDGLLVSNRRAHTALGGPPELILELISEKGGMISWQYVRNPLNERQWDDNGVELANEADEVEDIFFVAISETLARVRIRDAETSALLEDIDVSEVVEDYCSGAGATPICPIFDDSFETTD